MLTLEEISPIEIQASRDNTPELWNTAVLALEEHYKANPNEAETILRLGHIYWYLVFEEGVWNCTLDYRTMQQSLLDLYQHAKIVLKDNVEFLWSFAWMMESTIYYFEPNLSVDEENKLVQSMYYRAARLEPQSPLPILSGRGAGLFKNLPPSIMEQHCKYGIIKIYVDKVFENRGHWGAYFESGILYIMTHYFKYTGNSGEKPPDEFDLYVQQVIDTASHSYEK